MSDYFRQNVTNAVFHLGKNWAILSKEEVAIKNKVESVGIPLRDWNVKINYGIKTGFNKAFIIDEQTKDRLMISSPKNAEIIRPILFGENVKRHACDWNNTYLINVHNGLKQAGVKRILAQDNYPDIYTHLSQYKDELQKRHDKGDHWTNLRNCAYLEDFSKPKIIYPEITKFLNFYLDASGHFLTNNKCFILTGENLEYLVCFFNSKLFRFVFMNAFPKLLGDAFELRKVFFEQIMVKPITIDQSNAFKEILRVEDHSNLNLQANSMIYSIYGLNKEEIDAVEESYASSL